MASSPAGHSSLPLGWTRSTERGILALSGIQPDLHVVSVNWKHLLPARLPVSRNSLHLVSIEGNNMISAFSFSPVKRLIRTL